MNPCTTCGKPERTTGRTICRTCYNAEKKAQYHASKTPRKQVTVDLKRNEVIITMPLTDGRAALLTAKMDNWKANGYVVKVKE